ncbi:MAG TPA: hypothetical protein VMU38_07300 [Candidatus Binatia bacterium]|nr:hypothetical protein [Candidatus Binatia bacterium]
MRNQPLLPLLSLAALLAGCAGSRSIPEPPQSAPFAAGSPAAPVVSLDASSSGPTVSGDVYGASLDTWYDFQQSFVNPSLRKAGIHLIRFPGGSESDAYHWENGGTLCDKMGYIAPGSTFDNFMSRVAGPVGSDVAITLNYGSNRACDGGGDPNEAGAWVAHAKSKGYHVGFWTVGNEVYGSWEYDLHAQPHDPHTYADAVRTGYYPAVKKADANAQLGVVVNLPDDHAWNDVVLRKAQPFDFVEVHYYPEYNDDSDKFLLGPAIGHFAHDLAGLRREMTAAGVAKSVPIYLGEYNNDAGNEGKQSVSIVNGLFVGQMLGTLLDAGVPMSTFWLSYGSCDENGDFSKQLYGWQDFGSEALFSDGLPDPYDYCANTPKIPGGTPFPTGRVMAVMSDAVPAGSLVRQVSVAKSLGQRVRAYGFAEGSGYAFALFNNTLSGIAIQANVEHAGRTSFTATLTTYGKAQYDKSKENHWVGPAHRSLGTVGATVPITLPPYSLTILALSA